MVPPASRKVSRVSRYSGSCSLPSDFAYGAFTLSGWLSQYHSAIFRQYSSQSSTPTYRSTLVWPLLISLAATLKIDVSFFSCGYLDVSVPHVPSIRLCVHLIVSELFSDGFPHSDIRGSVDICSSPRLFAAYHVLLRLLVPRHPPYALFRLIFVVLFFLEFVFLPLEIVLRVPAFAGRRKISAAFAADVFSALSLEFSLLNPGNVLSLCNFQGSKSLAMPNSTSSAKLNSGAYVTNIRLFIP